MEIAELALWRSVLVADLQDHARGADTRWLGGPDFRHVCHLAELDPDVVMRAYKPEMHQFRRGRVKADVA
ncbi:MAG: hypothetical protein RQ750_09150 [Roseovarius sp.]|nr:hypothetical protein [Roseovarius sp.]